MNLTDATRVAALASGLQAIYGGSHNRTAQAATTLYQLGRQATALAVDRCERDPKHEGEFEARKAKILERVSNVLTEGMGDLQPRETRVRADVSGDPRGFCLKLFHPLLRGNSWGGESEGFGV